MESFFNSVKEEEVIEIYVINRKYHLDDDCRRTNLSIGVYRTEEGKSWVLPVVKKASKAITEGSNINHDYMPTLGQDSFTNAAVRLVLGENSPHIKNKNAFGIQTLSGTGALRVGAEFLVRIMKSSVFCVSDPTWHNHYDLFSKAGFTKQYKYRYWDPVKCGVNFDGMITDLKNAPEGAIVVLHACAHNPTGCDLTKEQWFTVAEVMKEKKLFPFFDFAYQGFASGDPDRDAFAVRLFVEQGFELFCAQSFSKNFGLYSERVGNLTVVLNNPEKVDAIKSKLFTIITMIYLTPPGFGCRIVDKVLNDDELKKEWMQSIQQMSHRIKKMRSLLYENLVNLNTPGTWTHIIDQIGMFSFTGLTEEQCTTLTEKYHIYLPKTGRINMCGLNAENVVYVARCIHNVVTYNAHNDKLTDFGKELDSNIQILHNVPFSRTLQKTLVR